MLVAVKKNEAQAVLLQGLDQNLKHAAPRIDMLNAALKSNRFLRNREWGYEEDSVRWSVALRNKGMRNQQN